MSDASADIRIAAVPERGRRAERAESPRPGPETPRPASETTRYLSAAAYIDREFRAKAVEIDEARYRAAAPELGIDVGTVVAHCRAARRRKAFRDGALCLTAIGLASTGVVADAINYPAYLDEVASYYAAPLVLCWLIATAIVFSETFGTEYLMLTRRLGRASFARSAEAMAAQASPRNVVVYGAFTPFVGSGFDLGGWSFAVNLEQAKADLARREPKPFGIVELYAALRAGFERLRIEGLAISDRLFVDGKSIRDDRRFLPQMLGRPVASVDADLVDYYGRHPGKTVRHYLCLEIADWSGELVLSTFIRCQKTESKLFIEVSRFLLPPLKAKYYDLDKREPTRLVVKSLGWLLRSAVASVVLLPVSVVTTWMNLTRPLNRFMLRRRQRKMIKHDPMYNYGALQSVRELGTANAWRVYFQKLDQEMHTKVVDQQMLDVLVAFLDEHGIDTTEIKDRGMHILNNGVIVSGGSLSAESLAVGTGAQAKVSMGGAWKALQRRAGQMSGGQVHGAQG